MPLRVFRPAPRAALRLGECLHVHDHGVLKAVEGAKIFWSFRVRPAINQSFYLALVRASCFYLALVRASWVNVSVGCNMSVIMVVPLNQFPVVS